MNRSSRVFRLAALGLVGGCLFQVTGCITGFLPVLFSLGESAILSSVFNALVAP
ncbi:MAG: hypothetical protein IIB57_14280 [Planctomycetes bacterium]|nr:hypothetical protein [Planctomycetota bacterium]